MSHPHKTFILEEEPKVPKVLHYKNHTNQQQLVLHTFSRHITEDIIKRSNMFLKHHCKCLMKNHETYPYMHKYSPIAALNEGTPTMYFKVLKKKKKTHANLQKIQTSYTCSFHTKTHTFYLPLHLGGPEGKPHVLIKYRNANICTQLQRNMLQLHYFNITKGFIGLCN